MKTVVFLLEEESAEKMLQEIQKRIDICGNVSWKYITFNGKTALKDNLEIKIKHWLTPNTHFIIIHDKDSADCKTLKDGLMEKCKNTGKENFCTVRIPCCELESFYLGDLDAVSKVFGANISKLKNKEKYRNPDRLGNAKEELKKITKEQYQVLSGSKEIAKHLDLSGNNKSYSFNILIKTMKHFIQNEEF